jgi:hypothetical protein
VSKRATISLLDPAVLDKVIHRQGLEINLWISVVDNSVDKHVDNFREKVIPNLSTGNPQVYPQDKLLILI